MLKPPHNRLAGASGAALGTLQRLRGTTPGKIDGADVEGYLSHDASSSDPIDGGIIMGERRSYLVSKASLPKRPQDNASVYVAGDEYTAIDVTDRDGYWSLTLGDELA